MAKEWEMHVISVREEHASMRLQPSLCAVFVLLPSLLKVTLALAGDDEMTMRWEF